MTCMLGPSVMSGAPGEETGSAQSGGSQGGNQGCPPPCPWRDSWQARQKSVALERLMAEEQRGESLNTAKPPVSLGAEASTQESGSLSGVGRF